MIDMHYARDGGRELFFPCMRLTRGFVVDESQKRSINSRLRPAYYIQLLAFIVWVITVKGKFVYMSMITTWAIPVGIVVLYLSTAFVLAKIYVGAPDRTAKAEGRLFEPKREELFASYERTRLFRWNRLIAVPLLGLVLYFYLGSLASWSEVDYLGVSILVVGAILALVPPSVILKWRKSRT